MEEKDILNAEKGNKESIKLTPKVVKIVSMKLETIGEKKSTKVIFSVKHPDKLELINISSVKYEVPGSLKHSGTWVNLDEDNKIRKGSALSILLDFMNIKTLRELEGKDINTAEDKSGYLCLKAY